MKGFFLAIFASTEHEELDSRTYSINYRRFLILNEAHIKNNSRVCDGSSRRFTHATTPTITFIFAFSILRSLVLAQFTSVYLAERMDRKKMTQRYLYFTSNFTQLKMNPKNLIVCTARNEKKTTRLRLTLAIFIVLPAAHEIYLKNFRYQLCSVSLSWQN